MTHQINLVSGIIYRDDKVLLCLRKNTRDYFDHWSLPMGHLKKNESAIDALRREMFEELAVQVIDADLLTTLYDNSKSICHSVYFITDWQGEIKNLEPDLCEEINWFSSSQYPSPLTFVTKNILKIFVEENFNR